LVIGGFAARAQGGVLRVGMVAPTVLAPEQISNDPELAFNRAIYDNLVVISPTDSSIVPNLATGWEVSDDGLTYTFTLAEGVTFHDGSPFSSADVVFTFNRLKEKTSSALALLGEFEVSTPDAQSVVFTMPEPNNAFLYGVAASQTAILRDGAAAPNEVVEGDNPYVNFNGTGPFVLKEYTPGVGGRAVFERNPNYWKAGEPALDGMEHSYFGDVDSQISALLSGEVEFIFKVPSNQVERLEGAEGVTLSRRRPLSTPSSVCARTRVLWAATCAFGRRSSTPPTATSSTTCCSKDAASVGTTTHRARTPVLQLRLPRQHPRPGESLRTVAAGGHRQLEAKLYAPIAFEYPDLAATLQQMWGDTGCINVEIETVEEGLFYDFSNPATTSRSSWASPAGDTALRR
jgi:peptide/nickel transport system substrate-binding protein